MASAVTAAAAGAAPVKAKKKNRGVRACFVDLRTVTDVVGSLGPARADWTQNRHVYITERTRYLKHDVPSVDTVVEEDKLRKKLALAQQQRNWKLEAQTLLQLGQLMKWKGLLDVGDDLLEQSAVILRDHTFADDHADEDDDQS